MIKNSIIIKYKAKGEKIRIFGLDFVKENKNNCTVKVNNMEINLSEYYEIKGNLKEIEIQLICLKDAII